MFAFFNLGQNKGHSGFYEHGRKRLLYSVVDHAMGCLFSAPVVHYYVAKDLDFFAAVSLIKIKCKSRVPNRHYEMNNLTIKHLNF